MVTDQPSKERVDPCNGKLQRMKHAGKFQMMKRTSKNFTM